jgi:hypothetical protein
MRRMKEVEAVAATLSPVLNLSMTPRKIYRGGMSLSLCFDNV